MSTKEHKLPPLWLAILWQLFLVAWLVGGIVFATYYTLCLGK